MVTFPVTFPLAEQQKGGREVPALSLGLQVRGYPLPDNGYPLPETYTFPGDATAGIHLKTGLPVI